LFLLFQYLFSGCVHVISNNKNNLFFSCFVSDLTDTCTYIIICIHKVNLNPLNLFFRYILICTFVIHFIIIFVSVLNRVSGDKMMIINYWNFPTPYVASLSCSFLLFTYMLSSLSISNYEEELKISSFVGVYLTKVSRVLIEFSSSQKLFLRIENLESVLGICFFTGLCDNSASLHYYFPLR
jgi:hypothetical protein